MLTLIRKLIYIYIFKISSEGSKKKIWQLFCGSSYKDIERQHLSQSYITKQEAIHNKMLKKLKN